MTISSSQPAPELPAPPIDDGLLLTCDAARLYPWGGFSGDGALFEQLRRRPSPQTEIVAEVFPPWRIHRPLPTLFDDGDPEGRTALGKRFEALDAAHRIGPATLLCASRNVWLAGGVLYVIRNNAPCVFHETFRPHERTMVPGPGVDFGSADETFGDKAPVLLLDSAGSFNYGHFLVDDLPKLAALDHLPKDGPPVTVLMMAYNILIDEARRHAVSMTLEGRREVSIRFLDRSRRYHFARLLHVTPSSEHPVLKSPASLDTLAVRMRRRTRSLRARAFVRRLVRGRWRAPRLFVDRNPIRERELVNRDAVLALVQARGFDVFDPETTHIRQQVARFAEAAVVVGIAGAGMTNTVFCRPGTPLLYLTPEGWEEPFYWDLAAARRQPYAVLRGPRQPSSARDHLRPFHIDLDALDAALTRIDPSG